MTNLKAALYLIRTFAGPKQHLVYIAVFVLSVLEVIGWLIGAFSSLVADPSICPRVKFFMGS